LFAVGSYKMDRETMM